MNILYKYISTLLLILLFSTTVKGQIIIDKQSFAIYQNGVLSGEIYREESIETAYHEHWVLYPNYVYPGSSNQIQTTIVPGYKEYKNAKDFLARVQFTNGSRYVKTLCDDTTKIPGR